MRTVISTPGDQIGDHRIQSRNSANESPVHTSDAKLTSRGIYIYIYISSTSSLSSSLAGSMDFSDTLTQFIPIIHRPSRSSWLHLVFALSWSKSLQVGQYWHAQEPPKERHLWVIPIYQPLRSYRIWHKVNFKRSLPGFNSEFSFS